MSRRESKVCNFCGTKFFRNPRYSNAQWDGAEFCSVDCNHKSRRTHGMAHTRLYRIWAGIKQRCTNNRTRLYRYYGARGITLCCEWMDDFGAFANYMGQPPGPRSEVGRIDNTAGYQPGNVRWETRNQNMRNTSNTRWVFVDGRPCSLVEVCEFVGLPYKRVHNRLRIGWSLAEALEHDAGPPTIGWAP